MGLLGLVYLVFDFVYVIGVVAWLVIAGGGCLIIVCLGLLDFLVC